MQNKKIFLIFVLFLSPLGVFANSKLDTGDTAWMMITTSFVLLMIPAGLALFYGGMTRSKNLLNTYAMVTGSFIVAFIAWILVGYSISFGVSNNDSIQIFFGGFDCVLLKGISWMDLSETYPKYIFVVFQGLFAAAAIAIASGSIIERVKFSSWLIFSFFWTIFVYSPIAHMVWGGEGALLFDEGALDFAGGTVVHMNGGLAGLVLAILVGKRNGYNKISMKPVSIMFTALGGVLLWFGWMGFNGGSAFGANKIAGLVILTTILAPSVAAFTWMILEYLVYKKITLLGIVSGLVSGLVAITPSAGFVDVSGSFVIGFMGSLFAFYGIVVLKRKFKYDDSLDAFGIHFLSGLWGALAVAFFAMKDNNLLWDSPLKETGSRFMQFLVQLESVIVVSAYTIVGTIFVYYITSVLTKGVRVTLRDEEVGLDEALHSEKAINFRS